MVCLLGVHPEMYLLGVSSSAGLMCAVGRA